ncbi:hypothetical protein RFI_30214 [Reticulomyxa filosa]|uniref:Uncharacterized protein n=1 Tax=Reticulomyxa filosa TaxID=46433 RepID=X6LZ13_RETFI|nr:hypothetical protein RFI_30214 [Reticulomyxa filosa]|eukprot:ETO07178.1 hypothetical protein RFI_30214 [Reticulomyxa filosa]
MYKHESIAIKIGNFLFLLFILFFYWDNVEKRGCKVMGKDWEIVGKRLGNCWEKIGEKIGEKIKK